MDNQNGKLERISPEELENYAKVYYKHFLELCNKYEKEDSEYYILTVKPIYDKYEEKRKKLNLSDSSNVKPKNEENNSNRYITRIIINILLLLMMVLPWFTFEACQKKYSYNGFELVAFQPIKDNEEITDFYESFNKINKTENREKTINKNDERISHSEDILNFICAFAFIFFISVLVSLISSFVNCNPAFTTILSIIMTLLIALIMAIILIYKSSLTMNEKMVFNLDANIGIYFTFIFSLILIFHEQLDNFLFKNKIQ